MEERSRCWAPLGAIKKTRGEVDLVRGAPAIELGPGQKVDSAEYARFEEEAKPGQYVLLAVTDTGVGICPAARKDAVKLRS